MTDDERTNTTDLLLALGRGERQALDELMPRVAGELRRLARSKLRKELPGQSLESMALVNEAYLRLVDARRVAPQTRSHFLGIAANVMRQILVDRARRRRTAKRGGEEVRVSLSGAIAGPNASLELADALAVHEALERLEAQDPREGRIVVLRVFGGMSIEETAAEIGVSVATVKREWSHAIAWLRLELGRGQRKTKAGRYS
jgi:RNA polymerase sigma factor (TIGR02999 family)